MMTIKSFLRSKKGSVSIWLFVLLLCLGAFAAEAGSGPDESEAAIALGQTEDMTETAEVALSLEQDLEQEELAYIMNLNLRYILNDWWNAEKDFVYASATSFKSDPQLTEERRLATFVFEIN